MQNISHRKILFIYQLLISKPKKPDFSLSRPYKNEDPVKLIYEKASFSKIPDKSKKQLKKSSGKKNHLILLLNFISSTLNFDKPQKISVSNPQQRPYNWVTAELVEWTSFDHQELQGILYKPEDFDPAKKYPYDSLFL